MYQAIRDSETNGLSVLVDSIGVAVPREPFSFGGWNKSRFGNHCDITGDGGVEFFSMRRKVTTKWIPQENASWMS